MSHSLGVRLKGERRILLRERERERERKVKKKEKKNKNKKLRS